MKAGKTIEVLAVLLLGLAAYAVWREAEVMLVAAGCLLATAPLVLTEEQAREFQGILGELRTGWGDVRGLPASVQALQTEQGNLREQLDQVRRSGLVRLEGGSRPAGGVSDGCARAPGGRLHRALRAERETGGPVLLFTPA